MLKLPSNVAVIDQAVKSLFTPTLIQKLKARKLNDRVILGWKKTIKKLILLGGASTGNKISLMHNGDDVFTDLWGEIKNATKSVIVETYIFSSDYIGQKTLETLIEAKKRGTEVLLMYDYVGSKNVDLNSIKQLQESGGLSVPFNEWKIWPWNMRLSPFLRNHRKLLIVDEKIAFVGGMNISNLYAGEKTGGTGYFRDTHAKVEGPVLKYLTNMVYDTLDHLAEDQTYALKLKSWVSKLFSNFKRSLFSNIDLDLLDDKSGVFIQALESNSLMNKRHIQKAMRITLKNAQNHCYLTTPYFLPPARLRRAIIRAASRGVNVIIITAGLSDVPIVRYASQHVYSIFLKRGVRIYEMHGKTLHAKTATIDGIYSHIGSFNLDTWSSNSNLEINIGVFDPDHASDLESQFAIDLKICKEVTLETQAKRTYFERIFHWAAYQFMRITGPSYRKFTQAENKIENIVK